MVKVWRLGLVSYDTALKIQLALARRHLDAMMKGVDANFDTLLLVEHKPVFTVGIRDETPNDEITRLKDLGAEFRKTNRGGLITFHGPGQLVAYPIINLKHFKTSVKWYVTSLEQTVINVCDELDVSKFLKQVTVTPSLHHLTAGQRPLSMPSKCYNLEPMQAGHFEAGIKASRSPYTGVWVEDNKIAAIGIHASRYVTTHGISLNCDNDLSWFDNIDPCGISDKGVTSLSKETGLVCTTEKIAPIFLKCFDKVFGCETEDMDIKSQEEILNGIYSKLLTDASATTQQAG